MVSAAVGVPVNDPALIAQLEGNSSNGTPVTDPALLSQLEGEPMPASQIPNGSQRPTSDAQNPLYRFAGDAAAGLAQIPQDVFNSMAGTFNAVKGGMNSLAETTGYPLGKPNLPDVPYNNVDMSSQFGVPNPSLMDKALQLVPQAAAFGPSIADDAAGILNAGKNAIGGAMDALKLKVNPEAYGQSVLSKISGGAQSTEGITSDVASQINQAYKQKMQPLLEGDDRGPGFNYFNNKYDAQNIIPPDKSLMGLSPSETPDIDIGVNKADLSGKSKQAFDAFEKNSTWQNARTLQSELGNYANQLKSNPLLSAQGGVNFSQIKDAQNNVLDKMKGFLDSNAPGDAKEYMALRQRYNDDVGAYTNNGKDLADIAKGHLKNPAASQLASIFKYPEPTVDPVTGKILKSAGQVAEDMGQEGRDRLIASQINTPANQLNSDSLVKAVRNLSGKPGMGSYVSPDITDAILSKLPEIQKRNERLMGLGKWATGGAVGTGAGYLGYKGLKDAL